jgi:hypothetical protein
MQTKTISELKRMNHDAGFYFFEKSTMRFFNSRVFPNVYASARGWYFVTSERMELTAQYPPKYTIRVMRADGNVDDASEFQQYDHLQDALTAARWLAKS